jgi:peroxiredoxin
MTPRRRRTRPLTPALLVAGSLLVPLSFLGFPEVAVFAQEPAPPPPPQPAPPPPEPEPDVVEQDAYAALLARYEAALLEHKRAIREETDPKKRRALRSETAEKTMLPEFEALVRSGDGRGLMWIAQNVGGAGLPAAEAKARRAEAWRALAHDHLAAPWVGEALELIKRSRAELGRSVALGYLDHAQREAPSRDVQAHAAYLLVDALESSEDADEKAWRARLQGLLAVEYADTGFVRALEEAARAKEEEAARRAAESEQKPDDAPPAPPPGPVVGQAAPALTGNDAFGKERSLAEVDGKVSVVVFFGFWSPDSRKALQVIVDLQKSLADPRVAVYGVSAGDSTTKAQEWIDKLSLAWPIVVQGLADAPLSERWAVREYPELWVLDPKGRVAGRATLVDLEATVKRELGKLP